MIANSLVNGLSWDSIDLKLDKWKSLTNKGQKLSKKDKDSEKADIHTNEDVDIISSEEKMRKNEELRAQKEKQAKFAEEHPRLAGIRNWFRKIFKKDKLLPESTEEIEVATEEPEANSKGESDQSFKEYIRYVAEYGENEARKKQLREKMGRPDRKAAMSQDGRSSLRSIEERAKELQASTEERLRKEEEGRY